MAIGKARLFGITIGIALLGAATLLATSSKAAHAVNRRALTITDAVIDFGRRNDRVTIKLDLDGVPNSRNVGDFEIQVIITDKRSLAQYDTGVVPPTAVR